MDFIHLYPTDIHFFIFTNKLCISITKKKQNRNKLFCPRELDTNAKVQSHFHEFHLLAFSVLSWRGVHASWLMNLPTTGTVPCSPTAQKRKAKSGCCTSWNTLHCPTSVCEETQSSSFASPQHPTGNLLLCGGIAHNTDSCLEQRGQSTRG